MDYSHVFNAETIREFNQLASFDFKIWLTMVVSISVVMFHNMFKEHPKKQKE